MYLSLQRVSKTFHGERPVQALAEVSFVIEQGEFVSLIGQSGSGKSTLCNLIAGLLTPDSGEIRLNGALINGQTGHVGYMPQRDLLMPWRTVLQNVILGAEIARKPLEQARQRARSLLPLFGLEGFADAYPRQLSGGMRQRAALLRTILMDRPLLLLDEPFGALDALTRREMQNWLMTVWAQLQPTVLFVTHDVREAALLSDRVLVLSARPGRLIADVPIHLARPRRESDEAFLRLQAQLLGSLAA
ncbi:MAG: nitrate ABC transporter ATP-binding protein [Candidatus Thermofonsia Clade 1 bacterium]|uniref:Nitrate ABC transporter ATP-binding protein n=1 Tax=Candidatus Thermofonsia Clade 1 bacterium TaxID=2364210 RepID=A0A2M8Q0A6_9CHLR|nr:MAG: nitrate ABC transporter ATP-binding protein [Candidatus Thermofonsia Clade 1 bacterium]